MLSLPSLWKVWRRKSANGLDGELDVARVGLLIAHLPVLYGIVCVNVVTTAFTFAGVAPPALVYPVPIIFVVIAGLRSIYWRRYRHRALSPQRAQDLLRGFHVFAIGGGIVLTIWVSALYLYGDGSLRSQVLSTVVITNMICSFILAQMPRASLALAGTSIPGFLLLALAGGGGAPVVAVDLALVGLVLAYMVMVTSRDFEALVAARVRADLLAEENRLLANTDSLTGLPNRREFFQRLDQAILAEGGRGGLVMGVIDLDGFKPINDLYGHSIGDCVLRECAQRLMDFAGGATTIARLGGDEFALFIRGEFVENDILRLGDQICAALRAPLRIAEVHAGVSASIGFARFPHDAMDGHHLYERADYALYYGKQHHRGAAVLFSSEHESSMLLNARIEQAMRKADFERELKVLFQPLRRADSGKIVAFEALARWNNPELGDVSPAAFIPVAEAGDLIHVITRTMMRKALAAARRWPRDINLSVNLSIRDLVSQRALTQIMALIASSGFDPGRLHVEVTETALVADFDRAQAALAHLKALGVNISLDDFGTGYSSLSYVHRLPLDTIKIDRSFVAEMLNSAVARDIVRSMIGLCGNLKLTCVTEGVETPEQFALLRKFGCDVVQGYLFGHPVAEGEVAAVIAGARETGEEEAMRA